MSEQGIGYLMEDSRRDLASARRFRDEGIYPKSINDSYYAAFYAAKAYLLYLDIPSKSHKSVQQRIAAVVGEGSLTEDMREPLGPAVKDAERSGLQLRTARLDRTTGHRSATPFRELRRHGRRADIVVTATLAMSQDQTSSRFPSRRQMRRDDLLPPSVGPCACS